MTASDPAVPQADHAERSVLGALLLHAGPEAYAAVRGLLVPSDFLTPARRKIYVAMQRVAESGRPLDSELIAAELERVGQLDDVGGREYLLALTEGLPRSLNIGHYARVVLRAARKRSLLAAGQAISAAAAAPDSEPADIVSDWAPRLAAIAAAVERPLVGTLLADVQPECVRWLWAGRIPRGKLTVLDGDPGLGKSTLTLDLAARVSRGQIMPDGTPGISGGVVLCSAEDDPGDTLLPRLDAAGADCTRILALAVSEYGSIADLATLRAAIVRVGAALVVVDPLMAYLGVGAQCNSWRDQDVRSMLAPLSQLAAETGAAVVLVRHLRKSGGADNPLYRGGGSIGIIGAARSGLLVARDPDDPDRRVLAATKSNLAREATSLTFRLADSGGVAKVDWLGESAHDASALLAVPATPEERGALTDSVDWLRERLSLGPALARDVQRDAQQQSIATRTLARAKLILCVHSRRSGYGHDGGWEWYLPSQEPVPEDMRDSESKDANTLKGANTSDLASFDETSVNTGVQPKDANGVLYTGLASFDGQPLPARFREDMLPGDVETEL